MKNNSNKKMVGFWRYNNESPPINPSIPVLPNPRDLVDTSGSFENFRTRIVVADYITNHMMTGSIYRGYSTCRICNCDNGSSDKQDDLFVCPEGYSHYLIAHNVMPDEEFAKHVFTKVKNIDEEYIKEFHKIVSLANSFK